MTGKDHGFHDRVINCEAKGYVLDREVSQLCIILKGIIYDYIIWLITILLTK